MSTRKKRTKSVVRITLRIPGKWSDPQELIERLPTDFKMTSKGLTCPDGATIECYPIPPDDQFRQIFGTSCRRTARFEEMEAVENYAANLILSGTGGSLESALKMMRAGAAIVEAGGAGVFIDNSGLAHGGHDWVTMTNDGSAEALSFAFVTIVRGKKELWTMGFHTLGFPDMIVQRSNRSSEGNEIIEMIQYVCDRQNRIEVGQLLGNENGQRFLVESSTIDEFPVHSPMHNPFGRMRLISFQEIAERN